MKGIMVVGYPVALTAMGKPLFKAPDGDYYERVKVTENSTQTGLHQGPEASVLVEKRFAPKAFRLACPCPYGRKPMQHLGYVMSSFIVAGTPGDQGLNKAPAGCVVAE
jgi:hypothetical protein